MSDDSATLSPGSSSDEGAHESWIGRSLAGYHIMRRLGEGGMGVIFLGRHQSLDRLAAIKFLSSQMAATPGYVGRFLNEAKGAANLDHPNIVAVYDAGCTEENDYYFIMAYIEGRDLRSIQRERGVFSVVTAVGYIRQAAAGLGYAHRRGVIHRDVKPDNLLLTTDGVIKVGDLGLAKWADTDSGGMTRSGAVLGTPCYISPEQVRGSRDVDARSDVYSLGATLYHLVTGKIPYEGSSPAEIMARHLKDPVPEPHQANPALDPEICTIIQRMMAKDPGGRYATMEQVDLVLGQFLSRRTGEVAPPGTSPPVAALRPESKAPVQAGLIVGICIITSAAILAGGLLWALKKDGISETASEENPAIGESETPGDNPPELVSPVYDVLEVLADGGTRKISPSVADSLKSGRTEGTVYLESFKTPDSSSLPADVEVFVVDAAGKRRSVDSEGVDEEGIYVRWYLQEDADDPAFRFLRLSATPEGPASPALFGLKFRIPELAPGEHRVVLLARSSSGLTELGVGFGSEIEPVRTIPLTDRWKMLVFPVPDQIEAAEPSLVLSFRGDHSIEVGEVRIERAIVPVAP